MDKEVKKTYNKREIESCWTRFRYTQKNGGKGYNESEIYDRKSLYAQALCRSADPEDVQWGIYLIFVLVLYKNYLRTSDYFSIHHFAVGMTRLGKYGADATEIVDLFLNHKRPYDRAAEKLRECIMKSVASRNFMGPYKERSWKRISSIVGAKFLERRLEDEPIQPNILSKKIYRTYLLLKQTPKYYQNKLLLKNQLESLFEGLNSYVSLHIYGSAQSLDCESDPFRISLQALVSESISAKFLDEIKLKLASKYELIEEAGLRTDELILHIKSDLRVGFDVSLYVNDPIGFENDRLLTRYLEFDERVAPLIVNVKMWATLAGIVWTKIEGIMWAILGRKKEHSKLSEYAYSLMVIHYLQCACDPPVLPNLLRPNQTSFRLISNNKRSSGELLVGFFRYYSQEFDFEKDAINMRDARRESRKSGKDRPSWANSTDYILIQDFYSEENVAKSVRELDAYKKIKDAFQARYGKLLKYRDLY